jgi:Mechanosensitive ion channel, conserved TM helix
MNDLIENSKAFWTTIPAPIKAVLFIIVGWLAAVAVRFIVSKLLLLLRFDTLGQKTGFSDFLRKGNVKYSPSRLAGVFVYWIVLLLVFLGVAKILDLDIYLAISGKIVQALPNLVAGVLIAIAGYLIVSFAANFVLTIALNASVPNARLLAKAIKWLGVIVVVTMALEQIGLGRSIVEYIFQIVLAALALGFALAFGLGCKDMAQGALKKIISNLKEKDRVSKGADLEG